MTSFYDRLLQAVLDIGEDMQNCGAEISRVEDSISRMCRSYDVLRVSVFTITSNITVTLDGSWGDNYALSTAELTATAAITPKTVGLVWHG